jgi:hypothetical protein
MEYAAGGELFEKICSAGRFSEDEVCFGLIFVILSAYFLAPNHVKLMLCAPYVVNANSPGISSNS